MFLSRACEYGIQAMLYLHQHGDDRNVAVSEISRKLGISASFLAKIVGQLAARGLLDSRRGAGGGVRLARPSAQLRLIDVVDAIDGLELRTRCIIGLPQCGSAAPCPFHDSWGPLRDKIMSALSEQSLASLMRNGNYRISRVGRQSKERYRLTIQTRAKKLRGPG